MDRRSKSGFFVAGSRSMCDSSIEAAARLLLARCEAARRPNRGGPVPGVSNQLHQSSARQAEPPQGVSSHEEKNNARLRIVASSRSRRRVPSPPAFGAAHVSPTGVVRGGQQPHARPSSAEAHRLLKLAISSARMVAWTWDRHRNTITSAIGWSIGWNRGGAMKVDARCRIKCSPPNGRERRILMVVRDQSFCRRAKTRLTRAGYAVAICWRALCELTSNALTLFLALAAATEQASARAG